MSAPEHLASAAPVIAWTQRQLVFERRPLGEVAEEFNRYNRERIKIDSVALRDKVVTGVFEANDPDSFVSFLAKIPGVEIHRAAGRNGTVTVKMARAQ